MIEKEIYDLTRSDLEKHSVWYLPRENTGSDTAVRPFIGDCTYCDHEIIVKTKFEAQYGELLVGYIFWSKPSTIENIQPTLFLDEYKQVSFWNGIIKPSCEIFGPAGQEFTERLPVNFHSEATQGLSSISGRLDGLYYLDKNNEICIVR